MGFWKKITGLFSSPVGGSSDYAYWVAVKCNRCGEVIRARVDLRNDLSIDYGEEDNQTTYFCRKTLMGEQHCFQKVEVELRFDQARKLIDRQISGGQFVEEEEAGD